MAAKAEKKLSDRIIQRKGLFVVRNSVEKFVASFNSERDMCQIQIRIDSLDRIYTEFNEAQSDIEKCDTPEMLETHLEERADFESRFCSAKGFLLSKRTVDPNQMPMNSSMMANPPAVHSGFHLRLPQIDLPKFSGDFSRWLAFRDTFSSMVHSNADIPTVAKLQYLLQSLQGEARKPFESVDVEADNYASTWEALLKRYDNKRFLKRQLFRALYDLPSVKRESSQELHDLVDDFQRHVKALAKLNEPVVHWDTPLVNILSYKLDPTTLRAWEEKTSSKDDVTYEEFVEFLYQHVRMLKTVGTDLQYRSQKSDTTKVAGYNQFPKKSLRMVSNAVAAEQKYSPPQCFACSENHFLFQCPVFAKKQVHQRRELVSKKRLCWNCFRSGHQARNCGSKYSCRSCHEKHHSLLHQEAGQKSVAAITSGIPFPEPIPSTSGAGSANTNSQVSLSVQSHHSTVLLETVELLVVDQDGREFPARALLDSASMCNFITKKLANTLNLRRTKVDIEVAGIGESTKQVKRQLTATIRSKTSPFDTKLEFLILKRPTVNLPTVPIDVSDWKLPQVKLADSNFHVPSDIDMIVGGETYHELHSGNKIPLGEGLPIVTETLFGWTVSGKVCIQSSNVPRVCHLTTVDKNLEKILTKFWELEAIEPCSAYSVEENRCERLFSTTTTRDSFGRYVVRLPLTRDPLVTLGESRSIAERRFLSLEKRLERDPPTKEAYCHFMDDYARLHHMKKLDDPVDDHRLHCYLPHHPVFKESSTTTKTRVVFDASCKTSSGFSVNDMQFVGPVVQESLLSIVMRFRTHAIAVVADIEKMYRQIQLHAEDRPLQRILWRSNRTELIATYELQTVTYGFASAPFLATRTLHEVAKNEGKKYPAAVAAVKKDFYVDDFLSGADDIQTAIHLREEVSAMLAAAGLPLKKWASNAPEVLVDVPPEDLAISPLHDLQEDQSVSTLGLVWETKSDTMGFKVQLPLPAPVLTKRKVMSYIAQIFDPLGLVGPTITVAKLFMQRLWALKTDAGDSYEWDRPLPPHLQTEWKEFHTTLDALACVRVSRFVSLASAATVQLHFFSDASEKAYGTCCYVRSESDGIVNVQLLTSKSKVAPLAKSFPIARLELCGAALSASLYTQVSKTIRLPAENFFWTDNTVTLYWLQSSPSRWKPFVGNRTSKIQAATENCTWRHVPGASNPADVLSRGISPTDIVNHPLWWNGPPWLALSPSHWPRTELPGIGTSALSEERSIVALATTFTVHSSFSEELFARYSNYTKLRRAVAYWMRYFCALRAAIQKTKLDPFEYLTTRDLREADTALCRVAQRDTFAEELASLGSRQRVAASSSLKWLKPTLGEDDVIRVGGRLSNASLPEDVKHPVLLKAKHPMSILLVEQYHKNLLHAGPQLMLATIRQKFWIIGGRDLVRHTYHQCYRCFRSKPVLIQQCIADLPSSRVSPTRPFSVCGVDYCGPVYIKSPVRNRAPTKAYIAIFVCFATRAVHIELVSDLSTPAFLAALRRFVARRGRMKEIHSDNGTAFKGADNELNRLYRMLKSDEVARKQIRDWCAENEIEWKFIPPRAPHFGGLWEAAVKSAKHHLLREVGNVKVSYEDMTTLLAQIEMCLNSRPLVPIPSDSSDLEVVTPGHFLVGTSLQAVPEEEVTEVPDNRLDHWKLTQKWFQRIWARWYPEYLQQLQARATKGCKPPVTIEPGRVVVIKDDNLPPIQWPLGKVTKVHPGKDGVVRVVTLRTATAKEVVRPVAKLALLPIPDKPEKEHDPDSSRRGR